MAAGEPQDSGGDGEAHDADDLAVFGAHFHSPVAGGGLRDMAFVGPGAETGFAAAVDCQGNPVHLLAVAEPVVEDFLPQAQWCLDGGVGVEPCRHFRFIEYLAGD